MVGEELIAVLPPELEENFVGLIRILQIIGGAFVIYLIFWIVNFFINLKRIKLLKRIEKKMDILDKKLDRVDRRVKNK